MGKIGYKHTQDALQKISVASKNRIRSEESKRKASVALKGRKFSRKTLIQMSKSQRKRKVSVETRKKISDFWRMHPRSKVSHILLYDQIRKCFEYRLWRSDCFKRDEYTCQKCGDDRGGNLHVHHLKHFIIILKENCLTSLIEALACAELWDINNGITVCEKCHIKLHEKRAR